MEEYLDGRHSSQKSAVYISVSWAESVSSEVLITRQWYVGLAGMSSRNLAFTLPDSVGWLFAHPECKWPEVFLCIPDCWAQRGGGEEEQAFIWKWPGIT